MRILTVLTYYRPHTSGLTIYAERLARALVQRGHEVTVLTSQFDPLLPREDVQDGVKIIRLPVWFRVSKGVIAPTFGLVATRLVLNHDAVLLHLPQFDAAGVAFRGRVFKKPTAITYHCDLLLPPGIFNRLVNLVVHFMNNLAGVFAHRIVAYTEDFACHSPYLTRFEKKRDIILPPVDLPKASEEEIYEFGQGYKADKHPVIGMATRFASEKGIDILLDAMPKIFAAYPNAKVLFAGQYQDVWGESHYFDRLRPRIETFQKKGQWQFLGVLNPSQMAAFYPNLDVLVVPSLNSTETFGLVQIEAMINGKPVVAANLPGVRQPVEITGMGEVVPVGDSTALAEAILRIFHTPNRYKGEPAKVEKMFRPDTNAAAYERLFRDLSSTL